VHGMNGKETVVRGARISLLAAFAAAACLANLAGCVGSGDDNSFVFPTDGGDAKATGDGGPGGDARGTGDGASDAGRDADAKPADAQGSDAKAGDATVAEAGLAVDATAADAPTMVQSTGGVAAFDTSPFDIGLVGCNAALARSFTIKNAGTATLIVAASVTTSDATNGSFSVNGADTTSLSVAPGATQSLSIAAAIPLAATAGAVVHGSLNLITTDKNSARVSIMLSATPLGATLVAAGNLATVTFAATKVGTAAPPKSFTLQNIGNAPLTLKIAAPSGHDFSLTGAGVPTTLAGNGGAIQLTAGFTPSQAGIEKPSSDITVTALNQCGTSLASVDFSGTGTVGNIVNFPSKIPFSAACGGPAPAPLPFLLMNTGSVPVQVNLQVVDPANAGFSVAPTVAIVPPPSSISPEGGTASFAVSAPPFPAQTGNGGTEAGSMPASIQATIRLTTDSNQIPDITLTEEPQGASLVFAPVGSSGGSAGVVLNAAVGATSGQTFKVVNKGTGAPAPVALTLVPTAAPDAGPGAGLDGSAVAGAPDPFTFDTGTVATLQVLPGAAGASANVTFAPMAAGDSFANIVMRADPTTLCARLPPALPVQGHASGLDVGPTQLTFYPTCDGKPVATQQFTIRNTTTKPLAWAIGAIMGPGAVNYTLTDISVSDTTTTAAPTKLPAPFTNTPQSLAPTQVATVTLAVAPIPSAATAAIGGAPWSAPLPAQLAAWLNVDSPAGGAVISLGETPEGDRLSVSLGSANSVPITSMAFGPVPKGSTSAAQPFVITNEATPVIGYPGANVSITVSGDAAFAVSTPFPTLALPPGGALAEGVMYTPGGEGPAVPTTITVAQRDPTAPLCASLPTPIALSGSGLLAAAAVSPTAWDFGPVTCGLAAAKPVTITVSNPAATSNLPFRVMSVTFGNPNSPYSFQTTPAPPAIPVGGSWTFNVTSSLPTIGVDPNNPHAFDDTLTVTTDIGGTIPIKLSLEPQGAVIADTVPALNPNWDFGTVDFGSVGSIFGHIQNTGNAPATVTLAPVAPQVLPGVFGLATSPMTTPPSLTVPGAGSITEIRGQFTPTTSSASWTGQATLTVSGPLCQALPAQWASPTIQLSGSAPSASPLVTRSVDHIDFKPTECGDVAADSQTITLTNNTNQPYAFGTRLGTGKYYRVSANTTSLAPVGGTAVITVTRPGVSPGPGVLSGKEPYADNLFVDVGPAGADGGVATTVVPFTFALSWALHGSVLSLPAAPFYVVDNSASSLLPISNTGDEPASVTVLSSPLGAVVFTPNPVAVPAGGVGKVQTAPSLIHPPCASQTTSNVLFLFNDCTPGASCSVCQPLPSSVPALSCQGTYSR
jgi:hypothetical protein